MKPRAGPPAANDVSQAQAFGGRGPMARGSIAAWRNARSPGQTWPLAGVADRDGRIYRLSPARPLTGLFLRLGQVQTVARRPVQGRAGERGRSKRTRYRFAPARPLTNLPRGSAGRGGALSHKPTATLFPPTKPRFRLSPAGRRFARPMVAALAVKIDRQDVGIAVLKAAATNWRDELLTFAQTAAGFSLRP
jgi:hypothetical protein